MNDLDTLLPEALGRAKAQGVADPRSQAKAEVIKRIHRRRLAGTTSALGAAAVLIGGTIFGLEVLRDQPRTLEGVETEEIGGHEALPEPPESLRAKVQPSVRDLIVPGLVLLYRDEDGEYHAALESPGMTKKVLECPPGVLCPGNTASLVTVHRDGSLDSRHAGWLDVPEVPPGAEVLWEAAPAEGAIGIESMGACDRIEHFVPLYTCANGEPVRIMVEFVRLRGGGRAQVPERNWIVQTDEGKVVFVATTDREVARQDIQVMTEPEPTDAFVRVERVSRYGSDSGEHLPSVLSVEELSSRSRFFHGVPVRSSIGRLPIGSNVVMECYAGCPMYEVSLWIGPEASRTTWAQARYVLENLKLPTR